MRSSIFVALLFNKVPPTQVNWPIKSLHYFQRGKLLRYVTAKKKKRSHSTTWMLIFYPTDFHSLFLLMAVVNSRFMTAAQDLVDGYWPILLTK